MRIIVVYAASGKPMENRVMVIALPIGRPRRYNTTVDEQAAERELGFVGHIKHSLSIVAAVIWLAAFPKLPGTAIWCHFGTAEPLPSYNRFIRCVSSACRASLKTFGSASNVK